MLRRLFVLPFVAALALALFGGSAKAANPSSVSVGPASTTATVQGQTFLLGLTADVSECTGDQVLNLVCDFFTVTAQGAGTTEICINFDQTFDFDLYVFAGGTTVFSSGTAITSSTSPTGSQECVTFQATAGQTFQIVVVPFFVINAGYTATIRFTPSSTGGTQGGGPGPGFSGSKMSGGTQASSFNVVVNAFNGTFTQGHGKVRISGPTCDIRSDSYTAFVTSDGADPNNPKHTMGHAHVTGTATVNGMTVNFDLTVYDRHEPGAGYDMVQIDQPSNCALPLTTISNGNYQYVPPTT